jgi:hypothetical protein
MTQKNKDFLTTLRDWIIYILGGFSFFMLTNIYNKIERIDAKTNENSEQIQILKTITDAHEKSLDYHRDVLSRISTPPTYLKQN